MSTIGKRTIYVGPAGVGSAMPQHVEGVALASILPGTLLKRSANGFNASTDASNVVSMEKIFADKDQMRSKSVDDAWTANENMVAIHARSGEFLNVLVATGQTLDIGDPLTSNGDGTLKKATKLNTGTTGGTEAGEDVIIAYADEAVTTTAAQLVRVRIA